MKKIYLLLAFILLIGRLNAQNCNVSNVPYSFQMNTAACKYLTVNNAFYGVSDVFVFWPNQMNVELSDYPGQDFSNAQCTFDNLINLVAGKKYIIDISYWNDCDIKLSYKQLSSQFNPTTIFDAHPTCYYTGETYEITPTVTGMYEFTLNFNT